MRVLFVVSAQRGHVDFGGMGATTLGGRLESLGHQIAWISAPAQVQRLRELGFLADPDASIPMLGLARWLTPTSSDSSGALPVWHDGPDAVRKFEKLLRERKPDLLIIDRLLVVAAMVAEHLGIPYAALGTPGDYYSLHEGSVLRCAGPIERYAAIGESLRTRLGWTTGSLDSFWVVSPYLNICFLGRSFYTPPAAGPSAHIWHFDEPPLTQACARTGISFGNQGDPRLLKAVIGCLSNGGALDRHTDVFVGDNDELYREISELDQGPSFDVHRWVDLGHYLPKLRYLTFFGGIGTIWLCVNYRVPMLVVPGLVGDQVANSRAVARLGLGTSLTPGLIRGSEVASALALLADMDPFLESIATFRAKENYTDSLETACQKLERLRC